MTGKELLNNLGMCPGVIGYQYLLKGFEIIRENPEKLQYVTKFLYPEIAAAYAANWHSVERGLRTTLAGCWNKGNRSFLDEMVGYHLKACPTVSEFFAIAWLYLCEKENAPDAVVPLRKREDCRKGEKNTE